MRPRWAFYHILKDGKSMGRVLASFIAQKMKKNYKKDGPMLIEPVVTDFKRIQL